VSGLGAQTLKGVVQPLQVYRVLGASAVHSRFEVATSRGLTPLVGREMAFLQRRWEQSRAGQGQVVLLSGEGGIGKSRLAEALREQVSPEYPLRLVFRCSPYHSNSALYPVIDHLQRLAGWQRHDTPETRLDTLQQMLQGTRFPLQEVVPLIAALLSVPLLDRYPPLRLTPERQRQQTLDVLVAWLLDETTRQPVLLLCEDLHWAAPLTLELLSLLIERAPTALLLVLLTFRPTFHSPWPMAAHLTHLTLNRLDPQQIERIATHVTGGKTLPTAVMQHAVSQLDAATLQRELTRLVEAESLYQRGLPPQATYTFKHTLIQAAYQALLKSTRQHYHRRIAEVLVDQFPETVEAQPELLAHHYTEAGLTTEALDAWQQAGRLASERSAHQEALAHLARGLALIETLPDPQDRLQHELPLQLTLGATLVKAKGHGAPEVEQTYARTRTLCQQMDDSPQLARVLYGLMGYYVNRAAYPTALGIAEQLLQAAQRQQDSERLLMAHNAMGTVLYYLGEFPRAHAHLEQGILLHDAQQPHTGGRPGVLVPRVANLR
jgi:predicted ATPase